MCLHSPFFMLNFRSAESHLKATSQSPVRFQGQSGPNPGATLPPCVEWTLRWRLRWCGAGSEETPRASRGAPATCLPPRLHGHSSPPSPHPTLPNRAPRSRLSTPRPHSRDQQARQVPSRDSVYPTVSYLTRALIRLPTPSVSARRLHTAATRRHRGGTHVTAAGRTRGPQVRCRASGPPAQQGGTSRGSG